jgi:hypothetical protein
MMQKRRNRESIGRSFTFTLAVALLASLWACVGSETGQQTSSRGSNPDAARSRPVERARGGAVYLDTVAPINYQLFESKADDEEPKKVTYRLMALGPGTLESMTKTIRLALDSLQRADTSLVAVRAVLYVVRPSGRMEGKLIPVVWGEWVPPDGWDAAAVSERRRIHRSYVYSVNPGWDRQAVVEEE